MSKNVQSTEEILARLRAFMARHRSTHRLMSLGVFGSFARGDAGPDSDVDVVFETDAPNLFRTASMRVELEALLERPVDIVRLREEMDPGLRQRILREAKCV